MFDSIDFFDGDGGGDNSKVTAVAGKIALWILHISKITFLIYSGYHGVSATLNYTGGGEVARMAGIVGITTLEITLFGLYMAWHTHQITGAAQSVAAGITYALGFTLACLGIVADSRIHAGFELGQWLQVYMATFLPLSPAAMALGALFTHELAPSQRAKRAEATAKSELQQIKFEAQIAQQKAAVEMAKMKANMQLNAQMSAMKQIGAWYGSEEAQKAITGTALQNAPAMLRAVGFDVTDQPATMTSANANKNTSSPPTRPTPSATTPQTLVNEAESVEDDEVTPTPPTHTNGVTKRVVVEDNTRPKA
ncbi:MAG TPA: hypothetical protein VLL52_14960 [Anaerolineae bacterium]|nr:hypothetical protein [Anaerolineae bacterium]